MIGFTLPFFFGQISEILIQDQKDNPVLAAAVVTATAVWAVFQATEASIVLTVG